MLDKIMYMSRQTHFTYTLALSLLLVITIPSVISIAMTRRSMKGPESR